MVLRAIFFDLDNTLYDGSLYLSSAFKQIARYLEDRFSLSADMVTESLWNCFKEKGSLYSKLFDDVLTTHGLYNADLVKELVRLFHEAPAGSIVLYEDARAVLKRLGHKYQLGVITNGDPTMQGRKVDALSLQELVKIQIYTGGLGCQKPSCHGYQYALKIAGARSQESLYVGDNPNVDFSGAKQVGMHTLRLLRGEFRCAKGGDVWIDRNVEDFYEIEELISHFSLSGTFRSSL